MNTRKLFAGVASAAMALSLVGCGGGDKAATGGDKSLVVGTTSELSGVFSPLYYKTSYDNYVINMVYQSMLDYDADSNLVPTLAEDLPKVSKDGTKITFKLKDGIKFSDGTTLDANDVKFTFTLLADPSYADRFATNANFIEGYKEYHDGDAKELSGIKVGKDNLTITFSLVNPETGEPCPDIAAVSTLGGMKIVSDEQYDYKKGKIGDYEAKSDEPMGSGPYVLNSFEKSSGASLVRNENYTGEGDYKIEKVVIKTIAEATELTSLETGEINYFPDSIEADIIGPASTNENLTFNHYFRAAEGYIAYNTENGPTADVAVRQALNYATNREEFCKAFFKFPEASEELAETSLGYVPSVYWNPVSKSMGDIVTGKKTTEGLIDYKYDLEKAKQILDDAGWKPGKDGIREKDGQKLEIKFLLSEGNSVLEMLIPIIQKSWKELGVDLKQNTVDFNTLVDTVVPGEKGANDEWNAFFMATSYTGTADVDANGMYGSKEPDNYPCIKDAELDGYLKAGRRTGDEATSVENYTKAMVRSNELAAYLPVYGNELFNVYAKNIKGMKTGPVRDWSQSLDTAYIE